MKVLWTPNAEADLNWWRKKDAKTVERIKKLLTSIKKTPFAGIGKPEPLKYELQGLWSRRIDKVNRLVYEVGKNEIIVHMARYHYRK